MIFFHHKNYQTGTEIMKNLNGERKNCHSNGEWLNIQYSNLNGKLFIMYNYHK